MVRRETGLRNLKHLELGWTMLTDGALSFMQIFSKVATFVISRCRITREGLRYLCQLVPAGSRNSRAITRSGLLNNLVYLYANYCHNLGPNLSVLGCVPKLKVLQLEFSQTSYGLPGRLFKLQDLDLSNTDVSEDLVINMLDSYS